MFGPTEIKPIHFSFIDKNDVIPCWDDGRGVVAGASSVPCVDIMNDKSFCQLSYDTPSVTCTPFTILSLAIYAGEDFCKWRQAFKTPNFIYARDQELMVYDDGKNKP